MNTAKKICSNSHQIEAVVLTAEYATAAAAIISSAFLDNNPITKFLNISRREFEYYANFIIQKTVLDGLSVVLVDGDKVVACAIVEDMADPTIPKRAEYSLPFNITLDYLTSLDSEFYAGKKFVKNHLSHLVITAVAPEYTRQGLSKKVNNAAMVLARKKGFDWMISEFTNSYNQMGVVNHLPYGKLKLNAVPYAGYVVGRTYPFQNLAGEATVYLWQLNQHVKLIFHDEFGHINHLSIEQCSPDAA